MKKTKIIYLVTALMLTAVFGLAQSTTNSFTSTLKFTNSDNLQNYNAIRLLGTTSNTTAASTNSILSVINSNIDSTNMIIVRNITFTTSSNTSAYSLNNFVSYTNTTAPCFSVDIGVSNMELIQVIGVTTHTNLPSLYFTFYNRTINMGADNTAPSYTFADLENKFIGAMLTNAAWLQTTQPRCFVTNWNSTGNMTYIKPFIIQGSKLFFVIQVLSGTSASPNAVYNLQFVFRKL